MSPPVILDTNVFVAALFNRRSASAAILDRVRGGDLRMVWNESTRRETQRILTKIPPISWDAVADLFRDEDRCDLPTRPEDFADVPDPDDRKFAALAAVTGAIIITNDDHLLSAPGLAVRKPSEFR